MKFKSIQATLVILIGLCVLVSIGALTAYSAITSRAEAIQAAELELAAEAKADALYIAEQMDLPLFAARTLSEVLSTKITEGNSITRNQATVMLKEVLKQNPGFFGVSTEWEPNAFDKQDDLMAGQANTDETGHFSPYWYRDGDTIALTFLPRMAENDPAYQYYVLPKTTLHETVVDPYLYPVNGKDVLMTSFMVPIIAHEKFYGVAGVDMTLDFLQEYADSLYASDPTKHYSIISYSGMLAGVSGQPDMVGKPLSELHEDYEEDLKKIQAGEFNMEEDEGDLLVNVPLQIGDSTTPWAMQIGIPQSDIVREAEMRMWVMIGIGLGLMLVTIFVVVLIARAISSPIKTITQGARLIAVGDVALSGIDQKSLSKINQRTDELGKIGLAFYDLTQYFNEMTSHAKSIADGDLTIEVTPKGSTDLLGNSFVRMVTGLRDAIGKVMESSNDVTESATLLASSSEQAGQATNQIATTIQQVARGTTQQSESVNRTASSIEQMGRAIDGVAKGAQEQAQAANKASSITAQLSSAISQVAENAQAVVAESNNAAQAARQGSEKVENTLKGMRTIKQSVNASAQKVQEMGSRSDQIGEIVTTIEDIASQTNLLALNAAIEAARAGEAGKGFAVVADEVRKLAERSASSTKEIGDLIKSIQHTVDEAVEAMRAGSREVELGVEMANEAGVALEEILKAAEKVNQEAEQAAAAAEQMSASADELVTAVDSVSAIVEENTAATEEMAAGSTEVTQAIENIASVSEENSAAVEEVSASAEEMTAQVEEVSKSAKHLSDLAQQLKEVMFRFKLDKTNYSEMDEQIETFKAAHVKWVERAKNHLDGIEYIDSKQIPDHTSCSLGKWYYSRGRAECSGKNEFDAIDKPHAEFHRTLVQFVETMDKHGKKAAAPVMADLSRQSEQVVTQLDRLKECYRK